MPTFNYTVDDEPQETDAHQLTPKQILTKAELNPSERYLIEIRGKNEISYKDNPDQPIHIHEKQKFISAFIGAVPVSHGRDSA